MVNKNLSKYPSKRQIKIKQYLGLPKLFRLFFCKYKYEYLLNIKPKINMFFYKFKKAYMFQKLTFMGFGLIFVESYKFQNIWFPCLRQKGIYIYSC